MKIVTLDRLITPVRFLNAGCHQGDRVVAPGGVMAHFDNSASDKGGEGWFKHPDCKNGYNRYYLDNGDVVQLTPSMVERANHAGACRTKNANSYYYGLAIAAKDGDVVTELQLAALVSDITAILQFHQEWGPDLLERVLGHDEEAIFTQRDYPKAPAKWGKLGRKCDPTGTKPDRPVMSMVRVRELVAARLAA